MKKIILVLIFVLAFILRFFQIGKYPNSLDWDEASLGYNAYSILKTARDEYGNFLPLQFRSFGDYKPPLYVYTVVPLVAIIGLSEQAVRFPSAIFGISTVIIVYFLIKKLFPLLEKRYQLLIVFLFAISPWHIQFSRIAFEANVGLFWFVLGTYLFISALDNKKYLLFSALSFVLGIYTYHSLRLVIPVFVLGLSYIYRRQLSGNKKNVFLSFILTLILISPLLLLIKDGIQARFLSVSNIKPENLIYPISQMELDINRGDKLGELLHNRRIVYALGMIKGYFDHWDPSFLFLTGDGPDRHHAPDMGMLYLVELPFVFIGLYFFIFGNKDIYGKKTIFWWFAVAPLASALTTGTPHAVRALLYLPVFQVFTAFGIKKFIESIYLGRYLVVLVFVLSMSYYLDMYYRHGPIEQAPSWQYGYKEMVKEVSQIKSGYNKVIVTYKYDQPYVYFLFYEKTDPAWYQSYWKDKNLDIDRFERSFGNYVFRNIDWEKDKQLQNILLIGTPFEIPDNAQGLIKEIRYPDDSVVFRIANPN